MGKDDIYKKQVDEPVMSDLTILVSVEDLINIAMGPPHDLIKSSDRIVSVEDLINIAMGPPHKNVVNFKMIQTILHILARQMRMLSVHVDLRVSEKYETKEKSSKKEGSSSDESSSSTSDTPRSKSAKKDKGKKSKDKEEKAKGKPDKIAKEKENAEIERMKSMSPKEKKKYLKDKEENESENMSPNEKENLKKKEKGRHKEENESDNMSPNEKENLKKKEKGRHKEDKELEKMSPKEREKYLKDKEERELQQMSPADREKYLKDKEEKELASMSPKEREKYRKEKAKAEKKLHVEKDSKRERSASGTSIAITEGEPQKGEKVLIVKKQPAAHSGPRPRVGSIEVVTHSQFEMLEAVVKDLAKKAGPVPMPTLPDNPKLRSELAKGSASLTDTMQAMQVSARIKAAEQALDRMVGLLTQLAGEGAFPEELSEQLDSVRADLEAVRGGTTNVQSNKPRAQAGAVRKSVAIDPQSHKPSRPEELRESRPSSAARPSTARISSVSRSSVAGAHSVTHAEMEDAIQALKEEMLKSVNSLTNKASSSAENAAVTAKSVADKLDVALNLNSRISTLHGLTTDYAEQLSGFGVGITTQMQSFQEQMCQMRGELAGGLQVLETANNNAETAAVLELTERFHLLEAELDGTVTEHQTLTTGHAQLADELKSLVEAVEMLREQKADTDEVLDGLRDKADLSRLAGLLSEQHFAISRADLEARLDMCYDKFQKQENVWLGAIEDLKCVAEAKAEIMQLMGLKIEATAALSSIQERLRILARQLGEPKAAILTRIISKDGKCGACKLPALIEPIDPSATAPPPLPRLRTPTPEPCVPELTPLPLPTEDDKAHVCNRWVGGSHTLVSDSVRRECAPTPTPAALGPPLRKYTGYGSDGRLYLMDKEMGPCAECNKLVVEAPEEPRTKPEEETAPKPDEGDGDTVKITTMIPQCVCTNPH